MVLYVLGGPWVVISGDISRVTIIITHIRGLITPLITTHEPSSRGTLHLQLSGALQGQPSEGRGSQPEDPNPTAANPKP